jgi:hypothetical protein
LAVALARPAQGPHAVDHSRLDLDEALAPIALHGPRCCALGRRRGDGVIGRISKGDANHLRALDSGRAVISWRDPLAAEAHRRRPTRVCRADVKFRSTAPRCDRRCNAKLALQVVAKPRDASDRNDPIRATLPWHAIKHGALRPARACTVAPAVHGVAVALATARGEREWSSPKMTSDLSRRALNTVRGTRTLSSPSYRLRNS